jgi:hypothetical protein
MCLIHLNGAKCEFKHLSRVSVLFERVEVYDFKSNLIMILPRGDKEKEEFEALCFVILNTLDSSFEFPDDDELINKVAWGSFYDPNQFFIDLEDNHFCLDDSLSVISMLEEKGINTFGMAKFANRYWSTQGKI